MNTFHIIGFCLLVPPLLVFIYGSTIFLMNFIRDIWLVYKRKYVAEVLVPYIVILCGALIFVGAVVLLVAEKERTRQNQFVIEISE